MYIYPFPLLKYCKSNIDNIAFESTKHRCKIVVNINENAVSLFINKSTYLVDSIVVSYYDSFYGNVKNVYKYVNTTTSFITYPSVITVSKLNGLTHDTINSQQIEDNKQFLSPLKVPAEYSYSPIQQKKIELNDTLLSPTINALRINSEFIQSYIVEFSTFLAVLEAPLSSEIGEKKSNTLQKRFQINQLNTFVTLIITHIIVVGYVHLYIEIFLLFPCLKMIRIFL
jgi:hypothetical protein